MSLDSDLSAALRASTKLIGTMVPIEEIDAMRAALVDAQRMAREIARHDEEGQYTLEYRAVRAAELACSWLARHGV